MATRRRLGLALAAALAVHLSGCGLILYPERRGQKSGDIDPGVAILDGIGLLFFIIPGVIAFIVDFHHGTIYLPKIPKEFSALPGDGVPAHPAADGSRWVAVATGPGRPDAETIRTVVARHTGVALDLDDPRLEVAEIGDIPE